MSVMLSLIALSVFLVQTNYREFRTSRKELSASALLISFHHDCGTVTRSSRALDGGKEILAEELLNQVVLEQDKDPALLDLLRRRLNDHAANPESGVRWETLRNRLLKRQHA